MNEQIDLFDQQHALALSKKDIKARARELADGIIAEGSDSPLRLYILAGKMKEVFTEMQGNLHDTAKTEALLHGKKHEQYNTRVEVKDTGVTWDYSQCNDPELEALEATLKAAKDAVAARQKFLQTLTKALTTLNEDTGEVEPIFPAVRKSTEKITLTY